ncbi:hypothetical protein NPIL_126721 [Nephila pilipes]|uniref:Uncharacterized protein n=1 Tax=Nephila pilipes TaxID=299642 RepID=A0A8X6TUJ3_NEPPI|nr:hypothetical protein NPIL_126721 [Nephila pilipes]
MRKARKEEMMLFGYHGSSFGLRYLVVHDASSLCFPVTLYDFLGKVINSYSDVLNPSSSLSAKPITISVTKRTPYFIRSLGAIPSLRPIAPKEKPSQLLLLLLKY